MAKLKTDWVLFLTILAMVGFGLVLSVRAHRYGEVTSGKGALI